jgi:hypothetical protein
MAYALKTRQTDAAVDAFLDQVEPAARREDARRLCELMAEVSAEPAKMWGPSIVGFGSYHYRYDSGHEGDMAQMGFSPRKAALTLYLPGSPQRQALLARLGKHTTSKACIYVKRLSDVDMGVLEELVRTSWASKQTIC